MQVSGSFDEIDANEELLKATSKRVSLNQLKKAAGRRARNPCPKRSKDDCLRECVWADYTFWWGGECKNNDLFSEYISVICDKDLLDQVAHKKEVRNIARHLGYTVRDFGQTVWKNVTKKQLCKKVSSDTKRIKNFIQKTDEPWKDLGISKKTYDDIVNYAAIQYAEGKSFYGILDSVSKYITKRNIKRTAYGVGIVLIIVLSIVVMVPLVSSTTDPVGMSGEIETYRTRQGVNVTAIDTVPILSAETQGSEKYLDPRSTHNSILDLLEPYDEIIDVSAVKFSPTSVGDIQKNMDDAEEAAMYCDIGTTIEKQYVESVIDAVEKTSIRPRDYKDFKVWGILPGQQIYYGGAFGISSLTHHGIYLGDGVVLEVGQGPQKCKKVSRNTLSFKDQMVGLSTLTSFARRAQKQGSNIYILNTTNDGDPDTIIRRMKRALEVMGCWDYNILLGSCEHVANFISFGVHESVQSEAVVKGARWTVVSMLTLGALISAWMAKKRALEDKVLLAK